MGYYKDQALIPEDRELNIRKIYKENQKMREALEFYSDKINWSKKYLRQGRYVCNPKLALSIDSGKLASEVLKEIDES